MLKKILKKIWKYFFKNDNLKNREAWLYERLTNLPKGLRLMDAGAGEQPYKDWCKQLDYVSQDFCQYDGTGDGSGLQKEIWDDSKIDIVSDITEIPEPGDSFDIILCTEVLEHVPDPTKVLDEFTRLLKPGGKLILTAPFASLVHFAPYFYCTGFSRFWYEHHLRERGFSIEELKPNGDWFSLCKQEIMRLGKIEKRKKNWSWPLAYLLAFMALFYFKIRGNKKAEDLACFGWHCIATKAKPLSG